MARGIRRSGSRISRSSQTKRIAPKTSRVSRKVSTIRSISTGSRVPLKTQSFRTKIKQQVRVKGIGKPRARITTRKLKRPVRTSRPFKQVVRKAFDPRPQFDDQFFRSVRVAGQKTRQSFNNRKTVIGSGPIPPERVITKPTPPVTQFGSGGTAIKNVFGLIEQTSIRNAAKREQFKREGRTGSIFFESFFDTEFL